MEQANKTLQWPKYQASIFISPCRHWIPDPHHCRKQHFWVTVTMPDPMSRDSHTDEQIMSYVYRRIGTGRVSIDSEPQHGRGLRSISLPIRWDKPYRQSDSVVLEQALVLAEWWLAQIKAKRVTIDQHIVFDALWPCRASEGSLLEVPQHWNKPSFTGWF
ncbi:unnamed protein product [Penicillium salamii]|uniref:Uncharacterized protein n=1 Tax=Penicillium salamii TaxID=1612424 RepID=A0A9W4JNW9_9EURO|nr:unnamed protein product [Penicillium salamii]CAG8210218.1 unnamed protein product [Penicillium salamii]CAG8210485.1 unnamed protein product [Penicillium salamii]CAG8213213.1 unnamed protein product [Penicillium salamii]CAG8218157.1 unnamed protein product [Penicillium salamii]